MKKWFVGYWKNNNYYVHKYVYADTSDEAIRKSRIKNIKELYEVDENDNRIWKEKIVGYTIKSTSDDGVYYLYKNWGKKPPMWSKEKPYWNGYFKRAQDAKASLTKLLKVMPEYKSDKFEVEAIVWTT